MTQQFNISTALGACLKSRQAETESADFRASQRSLHAVNEQRSTENQRFMASIGRDFKQALRFAVRNRSANQTSCATTFNKETPAPKRSKKTPIGRKIALVILLVLSVYWLWLKINNPQTFPVRSVKIIDNNNAVDHQQLRQTILPFLSGGMLRLNIGNLNNALLQVPWVAQAETTRIWPDKLVINITEQIPVAHWNNTELMNNYKEIFDPGHYTTTTSLPWLNGPNNQQALVWAGYQQMNQLLKPLNLQINWITLTPRHAWEIELNNGLLLILGREQVLPRLQRFISVYQQIFAHNPSAVNYIDLRYSNGFAVKWKTPSAANPASIKAPE